LFANWIKLVLFHRFRMLFHYSIKTGSFQEAFFRLSRFLFEYTSVLFRRFFSPAQFLYGQKQVLFKKHLHALHVFFIMNLR